MFEKKYYCENCKTVTTDKNSVKDHKQLGHSVYTKKELLQNRSKEGKAHNEGFMRLCEANTRLHKEVTRL